MTGGEDYASREDYIVRLAAECGISEGRAEVEVDRALASEDVRHRWHVRRRGWRSDDCRFSYVEDGEPDPGPGPVRLLGIRPRWLESNGIERVEYCVQDLDHETGHLRPKTKKKRTLKLDQETVTKMLLDEAKTLKEKGLVLKNAREFLRKRGAVEEQIKAAISSAQSRGVLWRRGQHSGV